MDAQRLTVLASLIKQYDLDGMKYFEAKNILLEKGYSIQEIEYAAASDAFDGKTHQPKKPDVTLLHSFEANPAQAEKIAYELLTKQRQEEQAKINSEIGGAIASNNVSNGVNPYSISLSARFMARLGIPIFKLVVVGFLILAVLSGIRQVVGHIGIDILFIYIFTYIFFVYMWVAIVALRYQLFTTSLRQPSLSKKIRNVVTIASFFFVSLYIGFKCYIIIASIIKDPSAILFY